MDSGAESGTSELPMGEAHNVETGCWVGKEGVRCWEEEEFDFLSDLFCLFLEEAHERQYHEWEGNQLWNAFLHVRMHVRMYQSWEENQLRNVFHQVWNATPFPKEKTQGGCSRALRPSFLPSWRRCCG